MNIKLDDIIGFTTTLKSIFDENSSDSVEANKAKLVLQYFSGLFKYKSQEYIDIKVKDFVEMVNKNQFKKSIN
jgi:hypothetical protein